MIRVLVFDKGHQLLDEIVPSMGAVSWRLNNIGRAQFSMAYDDTKCTRTNLQYGNRVLISFDNGLPDWVGVIDTPRQQTQDGVSIMAYSAEHLFTQRVTEKYIEIISSGTGGVYKLLVGRANAFRSLGVDSGSVYYGGVQRKYTYHYNSLWKEIVDLAKLSGHDFDITGTYDDGHLRLFANWYDTKGSDKTQSVVLRDGPNIQSVSLNEQGKIANHVFVIGTGQTWGTERLVEVAEDSTSQADYGYREYAVIQSRVSDSDTLLANAEQEIGDRSKPLRKFKLEAIDGEPGAFGTYEPGDRVHLSAFLDHEEWAFDNAVRVMGMEYKQDVMRLEVEEW